MTNPANEYKRRSDLPVARVVAGADTGTFDSAKWAEENKDSLAQWDAYFETLPSDRYR